MQLAEAFKLALQSLWANKLRTILTLIGVVMGVASVIMVITLVNGANKYVSTKLSGYGADVFTVTRMSSVIFSAEDYFKYQKRKIIRIEDYQAVRDNCTECGEVGAFLDRSTNVVANGHSSNNTEIRGYTWTMLSLNNIDIALGRGFTPTDEDKGTHDAIVGYDIVDNLLGDGDPLGKEIRVDGIPYTIVGVGDRQGKTLGQSQDNWVAVPITTYQQTYGYNDSVNIYARANGDAAAMERAEIGKLHGVARVGVGPGGAEFAAPCDGVAGGTAHQEFHGRFLRSHHRDLGSGWQVAGLIDFDFERSLGGKRGRARQQEQRDLHIGYHRITVSPCWAKTHSEPRMNTDKHG